MKKDRFLRDASPRMITASDMIYKGGATMNQRTGAKRPAATYLTATIAVLCLLAAGCAKDPAKDVAKAKVAPSSDKAAPVGKAEGKGETSAKPANPVERAAPAANAANAAPAKADGVALTGQIDFIGSKVTGSHECTFKEWSGSFTAKDGEAAGGSLTFTVQTTSVVADYKDPSPWSGKLEKHFRSCDFFCVEKHPSATFVSKSITASAGPKGETHEVVGELQIRGITKTVTFPATITVDGASVKATATFSINRKDYQIQYAGKPDDLIRDDVVLKIDIKS